MKPLFVVLMSCDGSPRKSPSFLQMVTFHTLNSNSHCERNVMSEVWYNMPSETSLPVEEITKALAKMGYEVMTSDDAGQYAIMFTIIPFGLQQQNGNKSLFVHVPLFLTIDEDTQMQFAASLLEVLASLN